MDEKLRAYLRDHATKEVIKDTCPSNEVGMHYFRKNQEGKWQCVHCPEQREAYNARGN